MASFGAAISEHPTASLAVGEVVGAVLEQVGASPDLAIVFVSGHRGDTVGDIADAIRSLLTPGVLLGATAVSVIGGDLEAEDVPAISLWAGRIGPVEPVRLETVRAPEGTAVVGMPDAAAVGARTLILLSDPFSVPVDALVRASNAQYRNLRLVGGVASAAGGPGANQLLLDGGSFPDGAVGVLLPEGLGEFAVVSQGCRPVGEPYIVTASTDNLIEGLGMQPPLERLQTLLATAGDDERVLLSSGLHMGVVVDENATEFRRGDFLVRGIVGADHDSGGLRIGDRAPVGTTVQFHVRDADTATEDLEQLLRVVDADSALVFTCNGRGQRLFDEPHHDASRVAASVGRGPVAGMFCAGEIGPVGGENHVHGFTASMLFLYG
ncbi:MAG: FIST C-terminal domain-containing protein [Actinomycetota bacterium]